jgi:SAM-dependent methyltransferase
MREHDHASRSAAIPPRAYSGRNKLPRVSVPEEFKPISVKYDGSWSGRALFAVRRLVDLQTRTVYDFLKLTVPPMQGEVLDVGCGESPFAHLLTAGASYTGVDIIEAEQFGMTRKDNVIAFDGRVLPFPDDRFDHIICTEVIEHVDDPQAFVAELKRVLKCGGTLVATIPFSARVHHEPFDFRRLTVWGLKRLFSDFNQVNVTPRGSDIVSIAAKLIVVAVRLGKPKINPSIIWRFPMLAVIAPALALGMAVAHAALLFDLGSKSDPLGYSIICVK